MRRGILKEYSTTFDALSRLFDPAIVILTTYAVFKAGLFYPPELVRMVAIYTVPLVFLIFPFFKTYRSWRFSSMIYEAGTVFLAWATVVVSYNLLMLIIANPQQRAILLPYCLFGYHPFAVWAGAVSVGLISTRLGLRTALRLARKRGYNIRRTLMVGAGQNARKLMEFFNRHSWMGVTVVGFIDDRLDAGADLNGVKVLGEIKDLLKHIEGVDLVFIDLPMRAEEKIKTMMDDLANSTAAVYYIPDIFTFDFLINKGLMDVGGIPVVAFRQSPFLGANRIIKRVEDLVFGTLITLVFLPVMGIIALVIKLTSPGATIFKQKRCGLNGEEIMVYKFRTMNTADENPTFKDVTRDDSRVTPFGAFLRKTSLDELPQLFNVLGGSMSLVGPRPHALKFNEEYKQLVPGYMLRHQIKPGITGLAQVNGWRGETDTVEKIEKRIEFDHQYLNSWSIWLDLKIILLTTFRFFRQPTAY